MHRPVRAVAIVVLGLGLAAFAARADEPKPSNAGPAELRETLANGLEVVVLPSARARECAVVMAYKAGARFEQANEAGVSQLVARLLRRSACGGRAAGAAEAELAALAPKSANRATGSDANHELLWTWETVPEEKLGVALDIERDRLTALKPEKAGLDAARQDIFTVTLKLETRAWNSLIALAYPDCPLGRPRLGSADAMAALSLDAVEAWRKAHVRPDAGVLVIAGPRDGKAALEAAKARFASIAKPEAPLPAPLATSAAPKGPLRASVEGPSMARHVWLAFRGPEPGSDDEAAFVALTFALKDKLMVALQGKAHDASVHADARSTAPALLVVSATPRPSVELVDIEARARGAAKAVAAEAMPDVEKLKARVERMLDGLTAPLDKQIEGAKDEVGALVEVAADRALAAPLVARREALKKGVAALTAEGLVAKAKTLLSEDRLSIVTIEPAGK